MLAGRLIFAKDDDMRKSFNIRGSAVNRKLPINLIKSNTKNTQKILKKFDKTLDIGQLTIKGYVIKPRLVTIRFKRFLVSKSKKLHKKSFVGTV